MNTKPLQSVLENRKALHKNNLSRESVKFLAEDYEDAKKFAKDAPLHTSVKYRIATDESPNGRAEYMKISGSYWKHQESNVSAETGYVISDEPNIKQIDGKIYLDWDDALEILEIEFFAPKEEKNSKNSNENKNQKIQEILAKMQQFGLNVSDIINSQKSQEENSEDAIKKEIDSIKQMGENLREKRKNGDLIPSNEEMIRRAKFIENDRMKSKKSEDNQEKIAENSDDAIDTWIKADPIKNAWENLRKKWKDKNRKSLSNEEMLANSEMLNPIADNSLFQKPIENLLNKENSQENSEKKSEEIFDAIKEKSTDSNNDSENKNADSEKKSEAQGKSDEIKKESEAQNKENSNDSENKNPEPKKIGYKPENNPEKSSENPEQKAEQLLNESIFFLFSAINNQIEKGKLKAIDIIERIKDFGKSTSKKITNSAKNKEKNSDKNSNQNDELNKNNLEKQIDSLWEEIVKAREFLENSKNEGNRSLSLAAQKNIEETIEKMLESRKKLQEKLAKKSNNSDNKKSLDETKKESEAQNKGKDSNQNNVVHDFIQNHIGHLWSEIVKARKILENSKTENGESLSPAVYANIEETIDKMMAERKKLQEKLNKKWTNSESLKANEFSEKLAKIIEKEEEFKGHFIDVNAEIKTIEIALQHKNQKINALQNPKNFKQKASITWRNFKSFITRKPSELDQHLTEKVKLENELKTTQGALELVKNKQKELELERNTITNDFFNSL